MDREYISPSSLALWQRSPSDYYCKYVSPNRFKVHETSDAMTLGTEFDLLVKAELSRDILGVEVDVGVVGQDAKRVFYMYKKYAYNDLVMDLEDALDVKFEFSVKTWVEGVCFWGIPDMYYINSSGHAVILDFKVNGYYSANRVYPKRGWLRKTHEGLTNEPTVMHNGTLITLGYLNKVWEQQLCIYGWVTGEPVGSDFICAIDQLCFHNGDLIVGQHRALIRDQASIMLDCKKLWECNVSGDYGVDREKLDRMLLGKKSLGNLM